MNEIVLDLMTWGFCPGAEASLGRTAAPRPAIGRADLQTSFLTLHHHLKHIFLER